MNTLLLILPLFSKFFRNILFAEINSAQNFSGQIGGRGLKWAQIFLYCTNYLRMDSDRIRMESNSDVTFYHILIRIRIGYESYRIYTDTNLIEYEYKTDRFALSMIL